MSAQVSALRGARQRARRSANDVAARLGVAEATVLRWERLENKPTFADVARLLALYRETCPELTFEDLVDAPADETVVAPAVEATR